MLELALLKDENYVDMAKIIDNNFIGNKKIVVDRKPKYTLVSGHTEGGQCINCQARFEFDKLENEIISIRIDIDGMREISSNGMDKIKKYLHA